MTLSIPIKTWTLAIRPKTLLAGIIPVLVGSFSTELSFSEIHWFVLFSSLLVAVSLTIAVNLINDALDAKKGKDTHERIGFLRVTQSGLLTENQVLAAGIGVLFFTFLFSLPLIIKGGVPILIMVLLSMLCSYLYTGGPYPISYNGLGELFVILFYGFGAVMGAYYLQAGRVNLIALIISLQMGCLATVMIAINNLRDISEDSKTGKRTLATRFGVCFGKWEILTLIVTPFLLNIQWLINERPLAFWLPLCALFIGIHLLRGIWQHPPSRIYNRFFGEAALLMVMFGALLIIGLRAAD